MRRVYVVKKCLMGQLLGIFDALIQGFGALYQPFRACGRRFYRVAKNNATGHVGKSSNRRANGRR